MTNNFEFGGYPFGHSRELATAQSKETTAFFKHSRQTAVLVIEDDPFMLKTMEQALRMRGFVVWAALDGHEGVDLYRRYFKQIDIVLSDVQMPGLDGPRTLDTIREINSSVRFCFMTGDIRVSTVNTLLARGALRVFPKPFPSVKEVTDELWELATRKYEFLIYRDVQDDHATPPPVSLLSNQPEDSESRGFFGRCFCQLRRSVLSFGSLLTNRSPAHRSPFEPSEEPQSLERDLAVPTDQRHGFPSNADKTIGPDRFRVM